MIARFDRMQCVLAPPLGITLCWSKGLLASLKLGWSSDLAEDKSPYPEDLDMKKSLVGYVERGETVWPDLPIDMSGLSIFSRKVLMTLKNKITFGQTVSYGGLAKMAGSPKAARAVGRIMASNPWPLLIPCHRVVGADGSLVGFSGSGLEMKAYLLNLEQGKGARRL